MTITVSGTTGVAGVDGSAGTPAVQGSDTNTGVFYPAADTVAIATGGSERLRVASAGQIGIGGANYGTSGQVLVSNGASAAPSWQSPTSYTAYTSGSGNWTIPSNGTDVLVRAWGGGGSGGRGGASNTRAGGGGGGGYCERWYQLSDLVTAYSTQVPYSVAAGGTSVSAAGAGNPGGNSTFGTGTNFASGQTIAYGGGAGSGNLTTGDGGGGGGALGAGGSGQSGGAGGALGGGATITIAGTVWGGSGGANYNTATSGAYLGGAGGGGAASNSTGAPGTSVLGGSGGAAANAGGVGTAGTAPGGGGGAYGQNSGTSGAGGAGRIEIWVW